MTAILETNIPGVKRILSAFRPTMDRVAVIKDALTDGIIEVEDKKQKGKKIKITKSSGLQVPDTAKIPVITGTVISVGSMVPGQVTPNMRVVFGSGAGTDLTINGTKFTVMRFADLIFTPGPPIAVFHDRVMIEPDAMPKMIGSIHVPDTVVDQPQCGKVLVSGVAEFSPGDRVLYGKFAGSTVHWQERDILVIRGKDIYAHLDENER